jgi:REP element-mobilizing transposase RayT
MPRKKLVKSDFLPYHVTARVNNREHFPVAPDTAWRAFRNECYAITALYEVEIHAFTMMPNHFHMLLTVPNFDLGQIMSYYLAAITRSMNFISGRSGHVFGGPYYWSLINSGIYYAHAYKYVYRNPVRANLTSNVEEYKYSTLSGLLGQNHLAFPLFYPRCGHGIWLVPNEMETQLNWLNRPVPSETDEAIRKGLRYKEFRLPLNKETGEPLYLP